MLKVAGKKHVGHIGRLEGLWAAFLRKTNFLLRTTSASTWHHSVTLKTETVCPSETLEYLTTIWRKNPSEDRHIKQMFQSDKYSFFCVNSRLCFHSTDLLFLQAWSQTNTVHYVSASFPFMLMTHFQLVCRLSNDDSFFLAAILSGSRIVGILVPENS